MIPVEPPRPEVRPPPPAPLVRSWTVHVLACCVALAISLAWCGSSPSASAPVDPSSLACAAARDWREHHAATADLQVVEVRVTFHPTPGRFAIGEGIVAALVALDLPGAQRVLDVRAEPDPLRLLTVDGIKVVLWAYPGAIHRAMELRSVALVSRAAAADVPMPSQPQFESLPAALDGDVTLTARQLQEHGLDSCKDFEAWVERIAGEPPYTEQVLRITKHVAGAILAQDQQGRRADDVCAALREHLFTEHQAQVAVVMAARQLGAPSLGLIAARSGQHRLVGLYVDGPGWLTLSLEEPNMRFTAGGPPLLTRAPIIGGFQASRHDFWSAAAAAYQSLGAPFGMADLMDMGPLRTLSKTEWSSADEAAQQDATAVWARPLAEVCP